MPETRTLSTDVHSATRRTGVCDIDVGDVERSLIALFRGKSCRIVGNVISAPDLNAVAAGHRS